MQSLFENGQSGILADQMGLGKTVQIIAFLSILFERGVKGPHIILVPLSTVHNWLNEFGRFAPNICVLPLFGHKQERAERVRKIRTTKSTSVVILAAYNSAITENALIVGKQFKLMIVDEGHKLKNFASSFSQ